MVNKLIDKGKRLFSGPQEGVLSAATIIMIMIVASRVLGLVRQRVLANFFNPSELSLFFAAFRLPDLIFEVLVFGTFSSAFIPVFTRSLKKGERNAWETAGRVVNIGLIIFTIFAFIFGILANQIYSVIAPGFTPSEIEKISQTARILFFAQGFFVVSYVLTGVLESLRRFLVPALAPIFYNLGIILGTVLLSPVFGLKAPAYGVVVGAFCHFITQLPLAYKLGFRFSPNIKPNDEVRKIGKLALPRIVDLSFDQIGKSTELYLASIISTASYTYYTFANSLQLLPVSLFGTSLAKAALPILSRNEENLTEFRRILLNTLFQSIFFTAPVAVLLIVLRIPIVRLVYGTNIFDWKATVQTGEVLSVFAMGIVFQTLVAILGRGFFALHDTKTPVMISMVGLCILVFGDFSLVKIFHLPVWALSVSFSLGAFVETILLYYLIHKRLGGFWNREIMARITKIFTASVCSGLIMYFFLKFFDKSVWVKRLSFLKSIDATRNLPFEKFVLDTRYTINLIILTLMVTLLGTVIYLGILIFFRSQEASVFFNLIKRTLISHKVAPVPQKEEETLSSPPSDTTT